MSSNSPSKASVPRRSTVPYEWVVWALIALTVAWIWIREGWFQIELFYISEVLSRPPHNASLGAQLATVFDWKVFDGMTVRLRPLSDLVEVIDAMMRPLKLFGTHPSLTVVAILLAVATVVGFYFALVRSNLDRLRAVLLTLLFVTTVGFLSCYVPYIRPAKKLVLLCVALTLLFSAKYRTTQKSFGLLWLSVLVSFFCDEAGFALWPIAILLTGPALVARKQWRNAVLLLALPLCYVAMAKWVIPPIYGLFGNPRVTSPDAAAYLVTFLLAPRYYLLAAQDLSAGVLISLGIIGPSPLVINLGIAGFAAALGWGVWKRKWVFVGTCLGLIAMSFSLSLYDMFNTPFKSNPPSQLTFYYHSPVGILVIFALAMLELRTAILLPVVLILSALNVHNFYIVNRALMIEHCYPLEAKLLPAHVVKPEELDREFHELTPRFQGQNIDWYQKTFDYYKIHPMGNDDFARRYVDLFKPHRPAATK
jgi:hypothetical protein